MVEAIESFFQRYGTSALAVAIITAAAGAFWWVADQAHRIQANETEIREVKAALAGHQDITPLSARVLKLEAEQAHLTATITRMEDVQGRMQDRLNGIDRRLTEVSANVSTNQEIARKILEQQSALSGTIADIKRALPGAR
jgi:chromosome segregation ATPase